MRPDRDKYIAEFVERRRRAAEERGEPFNETWALKSARQSYTLRFPPGGGAVTKARRDRRARAAAAVERRAELLAFYQQPTQGKDSTP